MKYLSKIALFVVAAAFCVAPQLVRAHEQGMSMSQAKTSPAFEKLKSLVGAWTGTMDMHGKPMEYTVSYELTAGGTAVVEREFAGTPKEMMTVYTTTVTGGIEATHYCMLGNQPHMVLQSSSGNTLSFEMQGTSGVTSHMVDHMHHLNVTFKDPNHITLTWTEFSQGKKNHNVVMEMTRKS